MGPKKILPAHWCRYSWSLSMIKCLLERISFFKPALSARSVSVSIHTASCRHFYVIILPFYLDIKCLIKNLNSIENITRKPTTSTTALSLTNRCQLIVKQFQWHWQWMIRVNATLYYATENRLRGDFSNKCRINSIHKHTSIWWTPQFSWKNHLQSRTSQWIRRNSILWPAFSINYRCRLKRNEVWSPLF